jgi:hypothetical protein
LLALLAFLPASAQDPAFEQLPTWTLENSQIRLLIYQQGAGFPSLILKSAPTAEPLWNPIRMARQAGQSSPPNPGIGHFLCLDGFGSQSPEETAAGIPFHGEASRQIFRKVRTDNEAAAQTLHLKAELPLVHETIERSIALAADEPVVRVRTRLTNRLPFDRPVLWAEHGTIGAPFLEPETTAVDMNPVRSMVRPYTGQNARLPHRLTGGREFAWPDAPAGAGTTNLRMAPPSPNSTDHTTHRFDTNQEWAFVTALQPRLGIVVGWLFHPKEFPFLQNWEYYPSNGQFARGLEFATTPFDQPRRLALANGPVLGQVPFRLLPALSTIESEFALFVAKVPSGFLRVASVTYEQGQIRLTDSQARLTVIIPATVLTR